MQDEKGRTAGNNVPMIYKALAGVIADVGTVAKDRVNKQQGFKFRSIDDVYNALHPALAKNKVVIIPRVLERKCEVVGKTQKGTDMIKVICKVKFGFYAEDGSNEEAIIYGEGIDTGDKATNKAMAIAYKYACFQVFCIPTEDMVDPDAESLELQEEGTKGQKAKKAAAPKAAAPKAAAQPKKQAAKEKPVSEKKAEPEKKAVSEKKAEPEKKAEKPEGSEMEVNVGSPATKEMIATVRAEQKRTGVPDKIILGRKQVNAKTIEELTIGEFKYIMSIFEKTPDRKGETE